MKLSGVSLRPATEADVPRLTKLVHDAYSHYVERIGGPPRPMTDDYAEVVRRHEVTVAEAGGEVVGLAVLGVGDEGFFIDNVAVDPTHQGVGVGKRFSSTLRSPPARPGSTRSTSTRMSGWPRTWRSTPASATSSTPGACTEGLASSICARCSAENSGGQRGI